MDLSALHLYHTSQVPTLLSTLCTQLVTLLQWVHPTLFCFLSSNHFTMPSEPNPTNLCFHPMKVSDCHWWQDSRMEHIRASFCYLYVRACCFLQFCSFDLPSCFSVESEIIWCPRSWVCPLDVLLHLLFVSPFLRFILGPHMHLFSSLVSPLANGAHGQETRSRFRVFFLSTLLTFLPGNRLLTADNGCFLRC